MSASREKILSAVRTHQGESSSLPLIRDFEQSFDPVSKFIEVLKGIGGKVYRVKNVSEIEELITKELGVLKRVVTTLPGFLFSTEDNKFHSDLATLQDVDLFISKSTLGVAENGAVWLKETDLQERVLPFIAKNLAVIIDHREIVSTMHEAYKKIGDTEYGFATFIAGPSKTADIEQSLVIGAQGAMSMSVFIL